MDHHMQVLTKWNQWERWKETYSNTCSTINMFLFSQPGFIFTLAIWPDLSDTGSETRIIPFFVGYQGDQHYIPRWDEGWRISGRIVATLPVWEGERETQLCWNFTPWYFNCLHSHQMVLQPQTQFTIFPYSAIRNLSMATNESYTLTKSFPQFSSRLKVSKANFST